MPKFKKSNNYTMKMGSRQIDGDTAFRMDSYAMQYNYAMRNDNDPNKKSKRSGVVSSINLGPKFADQSLGNPTYVKPGDTVNVDPDRINFLVNKKGLRKPESVSDSLSLSNYVYNTKDHTGGYDNKRFERAKKFYNSKFLEKQFPKNFERRNQLNLRLVTPVRRGNTTTILDYSKRSGN